MSGAAIAKKRGRKPGSETRSSEIRQRVARWKQAPAEKRQPLTELAAELGISHQLASYYASKVPEPVRMLSQEEQQKLILEAIMQLDAMIAELRQKILRERRISRAVLKIVRRFARVGHGPSKELLREIGLC